MSGLWRYSEYSKCVVSASNVGIGCDSVAGKVDSYKSVGQRQAKCMGSSVEERVSSVVQRERCLHKI